MALYLFYLLSFIAVLCGLMVILSRNPVHSVLYLIITFFAIAGHYVLLNAQFLAAVHVIVYAGAIMVLFLFVIMLLNLNKDTEPKNTGLAKLAGTVAGGLLLVAMVALLKDPGTLQKINTSDSQIGLVENLGKILFNDFMLPFEISGILFLAAIVGVIMLAKREVH